MNAQTLQAKEILARNLESYREHFNITQADMSKLVHMSYRGYGKLERLEVATSLDTVDKVAGYLGLSPALLLYPDMMQFLQNPPSPEDIKLAEKARKKNMKPKNNTVTHDTAQELYTKNDMINKVVQILEVLDVIKTSAASVTYTLSQKPAAEPPKSEITQELAEECVDDSKV